MLYILAFTRIFLSFWMLHEIWRCIGVVSGVLILWGRQCESLKGGISRNQAPTSSRMYTHQHDTHCWAWGPISKTQHPYDSYRQTNQTENGRTSEDSSLAIKTFIMQQSKRIQDFWKIFCRYRNACQNIRYPKFWFLLTLFGRYKEKKQSRIISANSSRSKILAHHVSDWFTCQPIGGMIFNI